ncbi:DUF389 domain-containing protein [Sphingomonas jaspsi]|uniref:DUF389 domain-containing protein n=1 Tax=Sphingomonas jaspsi TaxID=392409 RepID=UPI0004B43CE4|nr:DUF389 domain-containing protein [Sphingomonas jaspsi]
MAGPDLHGPDAPSTEAKARAKANERPAWRALTLADVARSARLDWSFAGLMALSAAIATLGLLQNSTAVVIGAMLVSPLMGPIMAIGFGLAVFESHLLRRGAQTLVVGAFVAIVVSAVIVWLTPVKSLTDELAARTSPTLLDLGVALVGGIAGVFSIVTRKATVMVGVAIATALVPPLATVGYGFVMGMGEVASGAALLFFTNTAAIVAAAAAVAIISRFRPMLTPQQTLVQTVTILTAIGLVAVPLSGGLRRIVEQARIERLAQTELQAMVGPNGTISRISTTVDADRVRVDAVIIADRYVVGREEQLANALRRSGQIASADVSIIQLSAASAAAVERQSRNAAELAAWAAERREADDIAKALAGVDGTDAGRLTIDSRLKRAAIFSVQDQQPSVDTLSQIAERFPQWVILLDGSPWVPPPKPQAETSETKLQSSG